MTQPVAAGSPGEPGGAIGAIAQPPPSQQPGARDADNTETWSHLDLESQNFDQASVWVMVHHLGLSTASTADPLPPLLPHPTQDGPARGEYEWFLY